MAAEREKNPLGLGPRDQQSSNTGSVDDTSYDAHGSDRYQSGEIEKDLGGRAPGDRTKQDRTTGDRPQGEGSRSIPADEDVPSSDEP